MRQGSSADDTARRCRTAATHDVETLFALAERVKVGDEQLAELVLHLARDEPVVDLGTDSGEVVRGGLGALACNSRRGVESREVDGPEVLGEGDGERGDERERLLVRGELRVSADVSAERQRSSLMRATHQVLERGPRHFSRRALAVAPADDANRLELSHDPEHPALLDDSRVVLLLLDVPVRGGGRRGLEALNEECREGRGEEVGKALMQRRDDLRTAEQDSVSIPVCMTERRLKSAGWRAHLDCTRRLCGRLALAEALDDGADGLLDVLFEAELRDLFEEARDGCARV